MFTRRSSLIREDLMLRFLVLGISSGYSYLRTLLLRNCTRPEKDPLLGEAFSDLRELS